MGIEYIDKSHAKLVVSFGSGDNRIRRVKRITYSGKKDAVKQYEDFKQSLINHVSDMTVEELLNWYIDSFQGKETTKRTYTNCAKAIISFFKRYKAKGVKLYDIDGFITSEAKKRSSKTIKNEVSLLSSAYTHAIRPKKVR